MQLAVLEKLNGQIAGINLRFHEWAERREGVERLGARPLALGVLDRPVTDVLRGGIAKNVAWRLRGRDVADFPTDDDAQFRLEIRAMFRKWNLNFPAVRQQRCRGFEPDERLLRQWFSRLARVIGIIQSDADDFRRHDGNQCLDAFARSGFAVERRGTENVAAQPEQFAVHDFGVKNFLALLKSANGCHKAGAN